MPTLHSPTATPPTRRPARRQRLVAALCAAGIGTLAGALGLPASGAAAPMQARSAADFRDSIGVQTHFPFAGYAYDTAPTDQLAGMLRDVGIRHLRDDLCFNTESACQRVRDRLAAMQTALGPGAPKVDLIAGYTRELAATADRATRDADIERALNAATSSPLAPMIAGLEPVNEPDLKDSIDWESATLADDDTFRRLLAEPRFASLRGVTHLSPAIGHASNTPALLASGWSAGRADVGNFHPYPPAWGGPEHALRTSCGTTDALGCAQALGSAAAPIATESGYSTSGTILSTSWVSERAQAIYLPRLLLENFRSGVARTYLYELIDLKPSTGSAVEGYGLWRAKATGSGYAPGSAKPAALALGRMNATIGDLGAASTTSSLDVQIRTAGQEASESTIRRVLLRRADGSYVLALWQPESVWNNTVFQQSNRTVADLDADITIGGTTWTIQATRPSLGDDVTGRWSAAQQITVPVGADVTLLDLRPDGTPAAPAAPVPVAAPAPATSSAAAPASAPLPVAPIATPSPAAAREAAQARAWQRIVQMFIGALTEAHAKAQAQAAKQRAKRAKAAKAKRAKAAKAKRAKAARAKARRAKAARAKAQRARAVRPTAATATHVRVTRF